jgi:hypothetical protein
MKTYESALAVISNEVQCEKGIGVKIALIRTFVLSGLVTGALFVLLGIVPASAATNVSYPGTPYTFGKNTAITTVTPTVNGQTPDSITISPDLGVNTGLTFTTLGGSAGEVSGMPTKASDAVTYTVTAWRSGADNGNTTLDITVNGFTYGDTAPNYLVNTMITPNNPGSITGTGGLYTVNPTLPNGLALDDVTGEITGTPSQVQGSTKYGVTRGFTGATATDTIVITVDAPVSVLPGSYVFRVAGAGRVYTFMLPPVTVKGKLSMEISDMKGRTIWKTSLRPLKGAKAREVVWRGKSSTGVRPSPGMYIVRIAIRNAGQPVQYLEAPVALKP